MPQRFQRPAKPSPYSFRLEIDGSICARFQDAAGLDVPHGAPRRTIILRRGVTTGPTLWTWRSQGNVPPKDGSLVMLDASGAERGRWRFQGGRVSKWVGPGFNAKGGDVVMDLVELTCERIEEA
ncbi:MAG: phage tail protein [Acidobacteriia bacterium]|nr:phage tail protein [Terriglobia bacterium]